jgi:hypothetical protein
MSVHCCDRMDYDLRQTCSVHSDRSECPDALIAFTPGGEYGIMIHDGGSSFVEISYCPWCGSELSKRGGGSA